MATAVLMGGPSLERPISLLSGAEVLRDLVARGRPAVPVILDPGARLRIAEPPPGPAELEVLLADLAAREEERPSALCDADATGLWTTGTMGEGAAKLRALGVDVIFLALHGSPGEDGSVQAWCEWSGFAHTSSGPTASALALDKAAFKALLEHADLPTPGWALLNRDGLERNPGRPAELERSLGLPLVVKAVDQGSSFGIHIAADSEELAVAIESCLALSARVLVEQFVTGDELTCAVLASEGASDARTLPIIQIVPRRAAWFDFESKYEEGGADEICPAPIPEDLAQELGRLAVSAHRLADAHGLTRCDFMLGPDGPLILELNTIPGLTRASLAPKAAEAAGLGFSGLIDEILEQARARGLRWVRPS